MRTGIGEVQPAGIALAGLGFALTRFVVVDAMGVVMTAPFLLAALVPLVAGMGLMTYGVIVAVGSFTTTYARTVTAWAYVGTISMLGVLGVAMLGSTLGTSGSFLGSGLLVANVLVGGAVGGAITGDREATNREQRRRNRRQADRGIVINRILRHEVLNAAAIVKGYADLLEEGQNQEAVTAIEEEADRIDRTINQVGQIAEGQSTSSVDLRAVVESVCDGYGDAVRVEHHSTGAACALADDRLERAIEELVDNAVEHGGESVVVAVEGGPTFVRCTITDDGPGMPDSQRAVLTRGALPEFDDPGAGFGLQIVRLLVESYGGTVEVSVDDGTSVAVSLPRALDENDPIARTGIPNRVLGSVALVSIVAGVVMGLYFQFVADLLPVIGSLYGVENRVVGWITHLFHSVVFGVVFSAARSSPLLRGHSDDLFARLGVDRPPGYGTILGALWGLSLAVVAAGIVMPVWLTLAGQSVPIPNIGVTSVVAHLLWGVVLGAGYDLLIESEATGDG